MPRAPSALVLSLAALLGGCITVNVGDTSPDDDEEENAPATTTVASGGTTTQSGPGTQPPPPPPGGMPGAGGTTTGGTTTTPPPPTGGTGTGGTTTGSTTTAAVDATRTALVQGLWLCTGAGVPVDDYTTSTVGGLTCRVSTRVSGSSLVVTSTSIPNHDFESGGGCCAREATRNWTIPLAPVNDTDGTLTLAPERGAIAVALNGAAIYGPEESAGNDVVNAASAGLSLGPCSAHSSPQGEFHYHADANCIHWHPPAGQSMRDYAFAKIDATVHSGIVGFAFDGYPIYGSYGWAADGSVKEITSSWRLKAGKTGSDASNDYEYVAGLGDLDRCNGRYAKTPEFPNGTYAYYSTRKNGEGGAGYPYFLACYTGVAGTANMMTGGGATGGTMPPPGGTGAGGGGTMPPPGGGGGGMMPPPGG